MPDDDFLLWITRDVVTLDGLRMLLRSCEQSEAPDEARVGLALVTGSEPFAVPPGLTLPDGTVADDDGRMPASALPEGGILVERGE